MILSFGETLPPPSYFTLQKRYFIKSQARISECVSVTKDLANQTKELVIVNYRIYKFLSLGEGR